MPFAWAQERAEASDDRRVDGASASETSRASRVAAVGITRAEDVPAQLEVPARQREQRFSDGDWHADILYGPVGRAPEAQPCYDAGPFELNASVRGPDDDEIVTLVGFRGGGTMEAVVEAIAAGASPGMPRRTRGAFRRPS